MAMKMADKLYHAVIKQLDNGIQETTVKKSETGFTSVSIANTTAISTLSFDTGSPSMPIPPSLTALIAQRERLVGPLDVLPFETKMIEPERSFDISEAVLDNSLVTMMQQSQLQVNAVAGEIATNSDDDTDIESCDSSVGNEPPPPPMSLAVEDGKEEGGGDYKLSRTFRSSYATVHGEEPVATNWNGDFKE